MTGVDINRACCSVEPNSPSCPTDDSTQHGDQEDGTWDKHFCYCEGDLCNTAVCTKGGGGGNDDNGGGGSHNGVIVPGKSSSSVKLQSTLAVTLAASLLAKLF